MPHIFLSGVLMPVVLNCIFCLQNKKSEGQLTKKIKNSDKAHKGPNG